MGKTILQTKNLTKMFNDTDGISNLSIQVEEGSFVSLLGPSGCGKTTTLNLLGGFSFPDSGSIYIDGAEVTKLEPQLRPCATVFQSYALFPQMTVAQNVAFGLKYGQRLPSSKATQIALETLEKVGLENYKNSYIQELSGGQQQRVAIARALATSPRILLLDEPLSNLDAKLRVSLRKELKELQRQVGITMIYVTHDQQEALELSDEVFLLYKAHLVQHGSPSDIYFKPKTVYAASFIGQANIFAKGKTSYVIRPESVQVQPSDKGSFVEIGRASCRERV